MSRPITLWTLARAALALVPLAIAQCQPPSSGAVNAGSTPTGPLNLPGVNTSELTAREQREWSVQVSELLSPCAAHPVSIAQCVQERRPCRACTPAAEFVRDQVKLGKTRTQVARAYALRFDPAGVKELDLAGAPAKGAERPTVTIAEWADFQCPFCAQSAPLFGYLVKAYPEHVRMVYKHYPLSQHAFAVATAKASIAAQRQGRFWELHDLLYAQQELIDEGFIQRSVQSLRIDPERYAADAESKATRELIERDRKQGDQLGLSGTPMVYVNGRYFDLQEFDLLVDLEPWVVLEIELVTGRKVKPKHVPRPSSAPPPSE